MPRVQGRPGAPEMPALPGMQERPGVPGLPEMPHQPEARDRRGRELLSGQYKTWELVISLYQAGSLRRGTYGAVCPLNSPGKAGESDRLKCVFTLPEEMHTSYYDSMRTAEILTETYI